MSFLHILVKEIPAAKNKGAGVESWLPAQHKKKNPHSLQCDTSSRKTSFLILWGHIWFGCVIHLHCSCFSVTRTDINAMCRNCFQKHSGKLMSNYIWCKNNTAHWPQWSMVVAVSWFESLAEIEAFLINPFIFRTHWIPFRDSSYCLVKVGAHFLAHSHT